MNNLSPHIISEAVAPGATVAVIEPGYADYSLERECFEPLGVRLEILSAADDPVMARRLAAVDPAVILLRDRQLSRDLMAACPSLRGVVRYGVGVDNIDLAAARARNVIVANVPNYGAEIEVSEHAVALYLAVQRRLLSRDAELRSGAWMVGQAAPIPSREGAVLGLIGSGLIGRETARKFRALGFVRVLVHDPYLSDEIISEQGFERADLDSLCARANVISLHAPSTAETRHMIDARRLGLMQRDAILINVARGGLIDEVALARALHEGQIFGAGVDVFETEPPAADNPLLGAPNIVLSDHNAWYSERSVRALQSRAAGYVVDILKGLEPDSRVNC